jgi:prevent-host-death family protein
MKSTTRWVSTKQLRAEMGRIVEAARRGESYLVLHRSRPAFRIVPPDDSGAEQLPLAKDPAYALGALGRSSDGRTAAEHDAMLYGA